MAWKESWQVKKGRQREKVSLSECTLLVHYLVEVVAYLNLLVETTTSSDLPQEQCYTSINSQFNYLFTQVLLHLMFLLLCFFWGLDIQSSKNL